MIVILFTGGTITMRNDPGGGGAKPGLTAAEIMQATRGIRAITAVETEEWGQFPGPHMTVERMWALRNRIVEHLARPEVTGVVITHGTDTLEESAYLVARSTASEKPIEGVSGEALASRIASAAPEKSVRYAALFADAMDTVASKAECGDMILTLGAGSISQLGPLVLQKLRERESSLTMEHN